MAQPFLSPIDLNKNEILNPRAQQLGSDPGSPVSGQFYYHTSNNVLMVHNGTSFVAQIGSGTQTFAGAKTFSTALTSPQYTASGQTGATTSTKYAGGTASGAPASGTFSTGDWIIAANGDVYVCTAGGTPGTWVRSGSYLLGTANTWTQNQTINASILGNGVITLTGTSASSVGGTFQATQFIATGQTGAAVSTKYAGGNASGSPGSGSFSTGDWTVTTGGDIWVCTAGGAPGTWSRVGSYLLGTNNTWTGTNAFNNAITGNNTINLSGTGTSGVAGTFTATALISSGLTGATSASRYVGATASGAPGTGTFAVGDFSIDRTGSIWICTTGGSPGTWAQLSSTSITPSGTVTGETSYGVSSNAGASATYSRGDHTHGTPSLSTNVASTQAFGDSATNGTGTAPSKDDHKHAMPSLGNVTAQTSFGAASNNGAAVSTSRSDHVHGTPTHDGTAHSAVSISSLAAATGTYSFGAQLVQSSAVPSGANDLTNKAYVDGISQGLDYKASVRVATTGNAAIATSYENGDTVDGVTLATGDRILLAAQTTASENGIYTVEASGTPTRAADANANGEISPGTVMYVEVGTDNGGQLWVCTATGATPWVAGTSTSTWTMYFQLTSVQAGAGLTATADILAVGQGTGITVNADDVAINTAVVVRKYAIDVGDNSSTSLTVTHNFATRDVTVEVFDNTTPWSRVNCDVLHTTTNTITLGFTNAPTTAQFRCVVHA